MDSRKNQFDLQPCAVVGAGDLVSHLQRANDDASTNEYRFSVFRFNEGMESTHALRPQDLRDMVKLCQVLAFAIVDDGWVSDELREELSQLANDLDLVTQSWSNSRHGEQTNT